MEFLGGFLGLADEAVAFIGAEQVVGAFASATDLGGALDLDFAFLLDQPSAVFHVPAEGAKERIQEIVAQLGLGVTGLLEFGEAFAEGFNEAVQFLLKSLKRGVRRHGAQFAARDWMRQGAFARLGAGKQTPATLDR